MKIVLLFALLAAFATCHKLKFKEQKTKAPKKPNYVTPELYCIACQAIVRETVKRLYHKTAESDVVEVMEDLCDMWRYNTYDFHPPMMAKGCHAIQSHYEEELEWALVHRYELEDVENYFCYETIKACTDIDLEKVPSEDEDFVTVDGEKVPVKEGKADLASHDHQGHNHQGHDHQGHNHQGHDHQDHDHQGHDHQGHDHQDHDHQGHNHQDHDHLDHDPHSHDHQDHEHSENT